MKYPFLTVLFLLIFGTGISSTLGSSTSAGLRAQCPSGDVVLSSNADIAAFVADWPGCTELAGNLTVDGTATNIGALELKDVGGDVLIRVNGLQNLDDFGLITVGGGLQFSSMPQLPGTMANGPLPLETVGGRLRFNNLPTVKNADAFQNLSEIGGLSLTFMFILDDLSALQGVQVGSETLVISRCNQLESLDILDPLDFDGVDMKTVQISNNSVLADISALERLSSVTEILVIDDNSFLESCAFDPVCDALFGSTVAIFIDNNGPGCTTEAEVKAECASDFGLLVEFYNATGGANWTNNSGWAAGAAGNNCTPCDGTWAGVFCNASDEVVRINLQANNIVGPLGSQLFELDKIESIGLGFNDLTGGLPATIGTAVRLKTLRLSNNPNLGGTIPAGINDLEDIEEIELSNCGLTGTIPFANIGNLTSLERLDLATNAITGNLSGNIGDCVALEYLRLNNNQMTGLLPGIWGLLPNLDFVDLSANSFNGGIPVSFGNATPLRVLSLANNNLTGAVNPNFSNLVNLEQLYLQNNNLTGALPKLDQSPALGFYFMRDNQFSGTVPDDLLVTDILRDFAVSNNQLTGPLPAFIANQPNLNILDMADNDFNGCYPLSYSSVCGVAPFIDFSGNADLPFAGSLAGFNTDFCQNGNACGAPCPPGDVLITTMTEYNAYVTTYPNCEDLPGRLAIEGLPGLTTLSALSSLRTIGDGLTLRDLPALSNLTGLDELTTIGSGTGMDATGSIFIKNLNLTDLSGLGNMTGDLEGLQIEDCANLTSLNGLGPDGGQGNRTATINQIVNMELSGNPMLTDISALAGVTFLDEVIIAANGLTDCAIVSVCNAIQPGNGVSVSIGTNGGGDCDDNTEVLAACLALPVSWGSFTATAHEKSVRLDWTTEAEENNAGFRVERSADGRAWTEIGRVAAGDYRYAYDDQAPLAGDNFYRIRQVDYDGASSVSAVRQVAFAAGLRVYPNPFAGRITVSSELPDTVEVYDAGGRLVGQFKHAGGGAQVQRLVLNSGVYTLLLRGAGERIRVVAR